MRLTPRDVRLVRDIALSHVLSRDQVLRLGYFTSLTRANSRLRDLRRGGLVRPLATPYFGQFLYAVASGALDVVGERIRAVVRGRPGSPRFLQHALAVTEVRVALLARGSCDWRFETQLREEFSFGGRSWIVRPDGLTWQEGTATAIEVDLGHVASSKFAEKLRSYHAFVASGSPRRWGIGELRLLTVTTSERRSQRLSALSAPGYAIETEFCTFTDLGVLVPGGWS